MIFIRYLHHSGIGFDTSFRICRAGFSGQAGFYGIGAYVSGILTVKFGFSPWLALPVAIGITALLHSL
jgi:hypothetical protein